MYTYFLIAFISISTIIAVSKIPKCIEFVNELVKVPFTSTQDSVKSFHIDRFLG